MKNVLGAVQPGRPLVPVRVLFGLLLCVQSVTAIRAYARDGYFVHHFHVPDLPPALVAPAGVYLAILAVRLMAALLVVFGRTVRLSLAVSGLGLVYSFLLDRLQFHHNRYSLALFALLLSLCAPRGRGQRPVSAFPVWLARVQVSLVYLASSGSKLLDSDWRSGVVLADRISRHTGEAISRGVPAWLISALAGSRGSSILALGAIVTELGLAVLLWHHRFRRRAIYVGLCFHFLIEATSRVELFSWIMAAAYGFFVIQDEGGRTLHYENRGAARWLAHVLKGCDWFARFRFVPFEPDVVTRNGTSRQSFVLTDRDGLRYVGASMRARVAGAIPLFFPLWPALALVARLSRSRDAATNADS